MLRTLTLAIIEAMLRILAAFPAGAGRALPRSATWHPHHNVAQFSAFGPVCVAFEHSLLPRMRRRKPRCHPILEVGWMGV